MVFDVRISFGKLDIASASQQATALKSSTVSFLDVLAQSSSDAVQTFIPAMSGMQDQSEDSSHQSGSGMEQDSQIFTPEDGSNTADKMLSGASAVTPLTDGNEGQGLLLVAVSVANAQMNQTQIRLTTQNIQSTPQTGFRKPQTAPNVSSEKSANNKSTLQAAQPTMICMPDQGAAAVQSASVQSASYLPVIYEQTFSAPNSAVCEQIAPVASDLSKSSQSQPLVTPPALTQNADAVQNTNFTTTVEQPVVSQFGNPATAATTETPNISVPTDQTDASQSQPHVTPPALTQNADAVQNTNFTTTVEQPVVSQFGNPATAATTETPSISVQSDQTDALQSQPQVTPPALTQSADAVQNTNVTTTSEQPVVIQFCNSVTAATTETSSIYLSSDQSDASQSQPQVTPPALTQSADALQNTNVTTTVEQSAVSQFGNPDTTATTETLNIYVPTDETDAPQSEPQVTHPALSQSDDAEQNTNFTTTVEQSAVSQFSNPDTTATTETPNIYVPTDETDALQSQPQVTPPALTQSADALQYTNFTTTVEQSAVSQFGNPVTVATTETPSISVQSDQTDAPQSQPQVTQPALTQSADAEKNTNVTTRVEHPAVSQFGNPAIVATTETPSISVPSDQTDASKSQPQVTPPALTQSADAVQNANVTTTVEQPVVSQFGNPAIAATTETPSISVSLDQTDASQSQPLIEQFAQVQSSGLDLNISSQDASHTTAENLLNQVPPLASLGQLEDQVTVSPSGLSNASLAIQDGYLSGGKIDTTSRIDRSSSSQSKSSQEPADATTTSNTIEPSTDSSNVLADSAGSSNASYGEWNFTGNDSKEEIKLVGSNIFVKSQLRPDTENNLQSPSTVTKRQTSSALSSMNFAGTPASDGTSDSKSNVQKGSDSASHEVQNTAQPISHAVPDAQTASTVVVKAADSSAAQAIPFNTHLTSGQSEHSQSVNGSSDTPGYESSLSGDTRSEQLSSSSTTGTSSINTAKLIQSINASEMRVGLNSSEFGAIGIRASITPQQVQAQITVGHGELGSAISAQIPSIQTKLGNELGVHASIEVNQSGSSLSGEQYQSQQREYKAGAQFISTTDDAAELPAELLSISYAPALSNADRLDIRA